MKFDELNDWEKNLVKFARVTKEIRPDILTTAEEMEKKLRKHDRIRGIGGWRGCPSGFLLYRISEEYGELLATIPEKHIGVLTPAWKGECAFPDFEISDETAGEIIDMMNFGMMLISNWKRQNATE